MKNPLLGARGATRTFGPQKGVAPDQLDLLEAALTRLADVVARDLGCDFRETAGAGAAGGLGFGLMSFCGATIRPGFDLVAEMIDLETAIQRADVVVTGEGNLDEQTLEGKTPAGVARLARNRASAYLRSLARRRIAGSAQSIRWPFRSGERVDHAAGFNRPGWRIIARTGARTRPGNAALMPGMEPSQSITLFERIRALLPILRCPRTHGGLRLAHGKLISEAGEEYPIVNGKPILVRSLQPHHLSPPPAAHISQNQKRYLVEERCCTSPQRCLHLGSGNVPCTDARVVSFDVLPCENVDVVGEAEEFPFVDDAFDLVILARL